MAKLTLTTALLSCLAVCMAQVNSGNNITGPLSTFKSRPDIQAPFLNVTLFDEMKAKPGYIFIAPYQTAQESIYMYDNKGNLVWSGFGSTGSGPSHNFHVCPVNGTDQLCFFTGYQDLGYNRGHAIILNNKLTTIASVQSQGGLSSNDQHEFKVVDDGRSAVVTVYDPVQYDMAAWGVTSGQGWLMNSWFQEIEIATGQLLFEWDALSHIPVDQSYVLPNTTDVSGTGLGPITLPDNPWDYFHMNSIDKFDNGDYLISGRHVSALYRISGTTGDVLWQLGAPLSKFSMDPGSDFTFQHDARILSDNATTTVLSLFDNASDGFNYSSSYSSGKIIKLDHTNNHATLLSQFVAPNDQISKSQGNCQVLDKVDWESSNVFCGWGSEATFSEYTSDGTMVQMGIFAYSGTMNYRAFKFNYTTDPTDAPAAWVYAHNTTAQTVYYVSWNGATEVRSWSIYAAQSKDGPWSVVDTVEKCGFETMFAAPDFHLWTLIEAVDELGRGIRNTTRAVQTFVPGPQLAGVCDGNSCPVAAGISRGSQSGNDAVHTGQKRPTSGAEALKGRNEGWVFPWMKATCALLGALFWVSALLGF